MTPSITDTQVFTALRSFVLGVTGLDGKLVMRGPLNRVAMPKGEFILISPLSRVALSTNKSAYGASTKSVTRSTQWGAQVDCYGALSGDMAEIVSTLLRDPYACEKFAAIDPNIQPLYATDPNQLPLVTGEQQYEVRWSFTAYLQYNPVTEVPQDSADELVIEFVSVDSAYQP